MHGLAILKETINHGNTLTHRQRHKHSLLDITQACMHRTYTPSHIQTTHIVHTNISTYIHKHEQKETQTTEIHKHKDIQFPYWASLAHWEDVTHHLLLNRLQRTFSLGRMLLCFNSQPSCPYIMVSKTYYFPFKTPRRKNCQTAVPVISFCQLSSEKEYC